MDLRPFKLADIALLDLQDVDHWALGEIDRLGDWEGSAFTILNDAGQPIGISGFSLEGRVGTGWLIGSGQLRKSPVFLHRTVKRVLGEIVHSPEVNCIHVTIENSNGASARWLNRLGFILIARSALTSKYMTCEEPEWQ